MSTSTLPPIIYSQQTQERGKRALQCSPFTLDLLIATRSQGIPLNAIAGSAGVENKYTKKSLLELSTESSLVWLIRVGLLRREVDGQGITDSFRLTPLGHQLAKQWENESEAFSTPSWCDRSKNALNRWLRLPI
ncbi:MAG: Npun_F0494 family protein [Cyanobacteria bacterium P01_E01_bin.42]